MAFPYRGPHSPRDDGQALYTNPLSPQRNPNRLSGGMMMATNDVRGGLTRRFTTNALPTLSPAGQQRKQAAGDYAVSSYTPQHNQHQIHSMMGGVRYFGEQSASLGCGAQAASSSSTRGPAGAFEDGYEPAVAVSKPVVVLTREEFCDKDYTVLRRSIYESVLTVSRQSAAYSRKMPTESQARQYEALLAIQRKLQSEMEKIDPMTRREVDQNRHHEESITQMMASSEPASPPEYSNAFPNAFSRPQRYSAASLTSPPGIANRTNRSSTQLTSPSATFVRPYTSSGVNNLPSQSVPGSRRQSDDEEENDFIYPFDGAVRAAANPNRNSMPNTGYGRNRNATEFVSVLGPVNTTSFLFDDGEDESIARHSNSSTTSPPAGNKTSLHLHHTADGFPKLIRGAENGDLSSALDLALARGVDPQQHVADRATASRHRISLPPTAFSNSVGIAPLNSILANADGKSAANNRRSVEVKFTAETKRPALMASPPRTMANGMQKPTSSYSTNDIPTLKSVNGGTDSANGIYLTSTLQSRPSEATSPEQNNNLTHINSHSSAVITRENQDSAASAYKPDHVIDSFTQSHSGLQAGAAPFGPLNGATHHMQNFGQAGMPPYVQQQQGMYNGGGYNMQMLNNGFNGLNMNGGYGAQQPWPNQGFVDNGYSQYQSPYSQVNAVPGATRYAEQPRMTQQQRRQANEDAQARFNSIDVEDLVGEIYGLCKDQYGCRFLQKKLDEQSEPTVKIIFDEVKSHIIELMTDPFGNYLCQKLLESVNVEQRTVLIQNAMSAMTKIALNQHGTRALQKMIELITTPKQIEMIIEAMRFDVVQLIQDLNGNHVIQKCLNHLSPDDAQFIFDAVGANCVAVGTHRHGCCVLQRCVDHADGLQKGALVDQVIANAFNLVQDPFGNYVVQYILDLSEPCFTEPLCRSFYGNIVFMSKQKFSSNVIEKCIRCSDEETRRGLIHELSSPAELEKLLRDSFANYVVQTAIDFGDEETKSLLIENIRPMLPAIRHTPYGRRIQSKISEYDARMAGMPSGTNTPVVPRTGSLIDPNLPYGSQQAPSGRGNRSGWIGPSPQFPANGTFAPFGNGGHGGPVIGGGSNVDIASPTPQRRSQGNPMFANSQSFHNKHSVGGAGFNGNPQDPNFGHF